MTFTQHQITAISKDRTKVQFGEIGYYVDPAVMTPYQNNDRVEVEIEDNRIVAIRWPPGKEPVTNGNGTKSTPYGGPISKPLAAQEKPPEQANNGNGKYGVKLLQKADGKILIHKQSGDEEWMQITGKAVEKVVRLKDGQLVRLKFEGETIIDINPVDENGEYDKSAWGGSGGGKGDGKGYRQDPTIDLIRNLSIIFEATLDKTEKWAEFCALNNLTPEEMEKGWTWIEQTTINTSCRIYQEIEKKHKWVRS
jgi:hypothetical protein